MAPATDTVTSNDGTILSYQTVGQGPGLIAIPGALATAADYAALAASLAPHFTVHTLDRRGHGASGPQGRDYSLARESEDVHALQARTGARYLFGHSFGGLVALEAARNNPRIERVAVYEPGVSIDGSVRVDWIPRSQEQLDHHRDFDAFVTFARGITPESTGRLPSWVLKLILRVVMSKEERRQKSELMPEAIREHAEVARLDNTYHHYSEVSAEVLLLVGGRGIAATGAARTAEVLSTVLPASRVVILPGLDHFGPEKAPERVAACLIEAFHRPEQRLAAEDEAAR